MTRISPMPRDPSRALVIGLLGHTVTSSNLGIGALTLSDIRILEEVAATLGRDIRFELTAWHEPHPVYIERPNLRYHPLSRGFILRPEGLRAMARRCDLVLDICGGDSFTDIYGPKRFVMQLAAQAAVTSTGTPLGFAPQTIGPFNRPWVRRGAGWIMRRAAFVCARDALSSDYVRSLKDDRITLFEATDVAFHLPYAPRPKAHEADGKTHVGVNVSGLLFAGGYTGKNEFGLKMDYPALLRRLIRHFSERGDCVVHLIGHVIIDSPSGAGEDDQRACEQLGVEFPGVIVEPPSPGPSEAKRLISAMDYVFGARMHACIAAFSSGVPVLPMAYSRKFIGLFGTLGYGHVADCRAASSAEVEAQILEGFEARDKLAAQIQGANQEAMRRLDLYRSFLAGILSAQAPRTGASERATNRDIQP
ncbi:polysaccharide pyruvyl transferase family protein [Salipiger pacificus]|nr:polysaccharide pyruvyl transferase family protein [Alloyangia pacifica]MCA0947181.1 polysaccharide pyruvyl transferase family protein [Alloyangia pacifica]